MSEVGSEVFQCEYCDKVLASAQSLSHHRVLHTGLDLYRCDECEKGFPTVQSLRQHKFTHGGLKPLKCEFCEQRFVNSGHLSNHVRIHTGDRPYKCDECEKSFKRLCELKDHKLFHGGKNIECNQCDQKFRYRSSLYIHLRTHSDIKPHVCDVCNMQFRSKKSLMRHKETHDKNREKKFSCNECAKKFFIKSQLVTHKKIHTDEFACDLCDYRACTSRDLKNHKASSAHRPLHECTECGRQFKAKPSFLKHTEKHLKVSKSTCEICKIVFECNLDLRKHMEVHQNGDPSEKREQAHVDEEDIDDPECKTEFAGETESGELLMMEVFEEPGDEVKQEALD